MTLSMKDTIARIRELIAELDGVRGVFAASSDDEYRLPAAIVQFPTTLIYPGPDTSQAELRQGHQRHTYEVRLRTFMGEGADLGHTAYQAVAFADTVIAKFQGNVTLGGRVNWCLFRRQSGFVTAQYNGIDYLVIDIDLEVSETAAATVAPGS